MEKPTIVILGAGYGGIAAVVKLQRTLPENRADIILVNRHEYYYQTDRLSGVAACTVDHDKVRIPIKDLIDTSRVTFIRDNVKSVHPQQKKVKLHHDEIIYDYLLFGLGTEGDEVYAPPGITEHAYQMWDIVHSRILQQQIHYNFATFQEESMNDDARLHIVVAGPGYNGIEFIGELANKIPSLCDTFDVNKAQVRLIYITSDACFLPGFDPGLKEYAANSLEENGVELITGATIKSCTSQGVVYEKDEKTRELPADTFVWAAEKRPHHVITNAGLVLDDGRVEVEKDLRTKYFDDIFLIGDYAYSDDTDSGDFPVDAYPAIESAKAAANNVFAMLDAKPLKLFQPSPMDTILSLGEHDAIGQTKNNHKLYSWKARMKKKWMLKKHLLQIGGYHLFFKHGL